jgi:hypothetical protein
MPIVGGNSKEEVTQRYDLKSAPPDGYVTIRRMSYGDKMLRRQKLGKATVHGDGGKSKKRGDFTAEMELINEQVTLLEFSRAIVDHNLTMLVNGSEIPVDFSNALHVKMLEGPVGEEIDAYITDWNSFEGEEETGK